MDLEIVETGNGGDLKGRGNDLSVIFSFENMIYLGMFGGNVEASTTTRIESEQAFDWWANSLIFPNNQDLQFNSLTERILNTTPLTSAGRIIIEDAIRADLEFMKPFSIVTVNVRIVSDDKVMIEIKVTKPDNLQEKKYIYIWDGGILNVLDSDYVPPTIFIQEDGLQYEQQFYL